MIAIGDLRIDRVEEMCGPFVGASDFLDGVPPDAFERGDEWLVRHGVDLATGNMIMSMHSWLVRTRHHNILIDTCFGNDKERGEGHIGTHLKQDWIGRLAALGLAPEDIHFVMCTHLHSDHVGWNTKLVDGRWVPTFPNARYIFARKEYEHWHPEMGASQFFGEGQAFLDSVLPCVEAGQAEIVEEGYTLDDGLELEAAPGHTPGSCIIRANSAGKSGLFIGDCIHSPLQLAYPRVNSFACELQDAARATRRRILDECVEHGHLLLPAHFPPPSAGHVKPAGDVYEFIPLA